MTNALIPLWELPGGIHPPQNKQQSMQLPLGEFSIPTQLVISLNQHIGAPAKAIVAVGDKVLAGQLIAAADGVFSANVHASSSGVVSAIGDYVLPHPSGMSARSIVINTDGKHETIAFEGCEDYLALAPVDLLAKIRAAGVVGLGGAGFPTAVKLNAKSIHKIDTLIINGAECEPYITADDMLMQVRAADVIAGTYLLSHILHKPARLIIAIEDNKPEAIAALQVAAKNYADSQSLQASQYVHSHATPLPAIDIVAIKTQYPSGGAKQLTQILTGREIPSGKHSADVNVICVNVSTVAATWRAVRFGEPLISRVTTLVGEALTIQRNVEVLIGTPIDYLLAQHGFDANKALRVVMGGPMMGFSIPELSAPIIKTSNCLLAASKKELPPPPPAQACIRCGLCAQACPVSLLPQQLFWYAQAQDNERLQAHNIFDCIECGACSYVCPSKIPLVQYYRAAKGSIRQHLADQEKADRSRQRFEFRKERLAKEDAEKEAKRALRKKAAEQAKQQLAEKNALKSSPAEPEAPAAIGVVADAVAKANQVVATPEEQRIKLERMLQSAKNNLASASAPLVPQNLEFPITEVQLAQQQSRIKQMQLKLAEAERKLAEFEAQQLTSNAVDAPASQSIADIAAAKAKQKSAALTDVDQDQKREQQIQLLEARLQKMQERLQNAEAGGDASSVALKAGIAKLAEKIQELRTP